MGRSDHGGSEGEVRPGRLTREASDKEAQTMEAQMGRSDHGDRWGGLKPGGLRQEGRWL